jgi:hypothetical protein
VTVLPNFHIIELLVCMCVIAVPALSPSRGPLQLARAKGALGTLATKPDVMSALMEAAAFVARRAEAGPPSGASECLRLADPTLRLLQRFSWDDAGLEALRRCV